MVVRFLASVLAFAFQSGSSEKGFSIMEALAGIVLLGVIVIFSLIIFNNILANPSLAFRGEAYLLASREIDNSINTKSFNDTSYNNFKNNLTVQRSIDRDLYFNIITVSVTHTPTKKELVSLSAILRR